MGVNSLCQWIYFDRLMGNAEYLPTARAATYVLWPLVAFKCTYPSNNGTRSFTRSFVQHPRPTETTRTASKAAAATAAAAAAVPLEHC